VGFRLNGRTDAYTDRQIDRQTTCCSITALCAASCGTILFAQELVGQPTNYSVINEA